MATNCGPDGSPRHITLRNIGLGFDPYQNAEARQLRIGIKLLAFFGVGQAINSRLGDLDPWHWLRHPNKVIIRSTSRF